MKVRMQPRDVAPRLTRKTSPTGRSSRSPSMKESQSASRVTLTLVLFLALLREPVLIVGSHSAPVRDAARQSLISGRFRGTGWLQWPAGHYVRSLELDAGVEPGDSGSPVLRLRDGAVIGVVRARTTPGQD